MRNRIKLYFLLSVFVLLTSAFFPVDRIRYFLSPSIRGDITTVKKYPVNFNDTIPNDTLYQNLSKEGYPLSYYRKITTGICFDNKCRMLDIILLWDITGRYLGFELPEGEFLSKTDHEPFRQDEYERLHNILADEHSPLANFSYNQLITPQISFLDVDAITGPTAPAVLDYVVQGAVYTTYQLWHFTYGQAKEEVEKLTIKFLSVDLILKILDSENDADKMWALDHIKGYVTLAPVLREKILQFINNDNYSLAERAISAISPLELADEIFQEAILEKFFTADYSLKQQLIDKLTEVDKLSANVICKLADNMGTLNVAMLGRVIDLFRKQHVVDDKALKKVIPLLKHENSFVRRKAYGLLMSIENQNQYIKDALKEYTSNNKESEQWL
ncbi:hypothetical protein FXV77_00225 [Sphingobacterium phlebotomi]|uniref:Uncharacterized protein n=1 Tax=Sphingobacterium phlebotomi TaxID=2605433 RepID=A0A5D4HAX0_9SPHI|nr:hypothetical protein [Sphingobacterium phlebotomi]TYR37757.1 hypothetical protein FXV77_00225 [Sphingobacterium phlebotomi]